MNNKEHLGLNNFSESQVIQKAYNIGTQPHKYISKIGNKYIYHSAEVKTPKGHGIVTEVKRNPWDIHDIQNVKVKVNNEEHEFNPEQVTPHVNIFNEDEKMKFNRLVELSHELKMLGEAVYKFDIKQNPLIPQLNFQRLLKKEGEKMSEDKKKKVEEVVKLSHDLEPRFWELKKLRDEFENQKHEFSQKKLTEETVRGLGKLD